MEPKEASARRTDRSVTAVELEPDHFVDPRYEFTRCCERITPTGLLRVFELAPKDTEPVELRPREPEPVERRPKGPESDLPTFTGRWHEEDETLDIDPRRKLRSGHHPVQLPGPGRRFDVVLHTSRGRVFSGKVAFGLERHARAVAVAVAVSSARAEVIRGTTSPA